MATVSGKIESKSRKGTGIKVDGTWYNGSKEALANYNWKDFIEFEADGNTITKVKANNGGGDLPKANGGTTNWSANQTKIEWQSARRDAITLVLGMIQNGVIELPAATEVRYDTVLDVVLETAEALYNSSAPVDEEEDD